MPEPSALPFPSSSPPSNDSSLEMEKQDPIRGRMPAISGACTVNCASSDSIKVFIWSQDGTIAQISGEIAQMFAATGGVVRGKGLDGHSKVLGKRGGCEKESGNH